MSDEQSSSSFQLPLRPGKEVTGGDSIDALGDEFDEAMDLKTRKGIVRPSAEELRTHRITHMPFRDWCPECVAGRAKDHSHRSKDTTEKLSVPSVHFDYFFPRNEKGGDYQVVLVGKDRETKMFLAHAVPYKGADVECISEQLNRDLKKFGIHGNVTLRSDQEPAITNVLDEVCKVRTSARSVPETAPQGDSQGNGLAERAVQSMEEMLRVHKLALETRVGVRLPILHPVFPWLVEHCANILNKAVVGVDGKTAWERVRGRKYKGDMVEFATKVRFRVSGKVQGGGHDRAMV